MKTPTIEKARQRAWAKSKLTHLQYHGGTALTPADHVIISDVLFQVFGEKDIAVPPGLTGHWGFAAWAIWMGEWE